MTIPIGLQHLISLLGIIDYLENHIVLIISDVSRHLGLPLALVSMIKAKDYNLGKGILKDLSCNLLSESFLNKMYLIWCAVIAS